MVTRPSHYISPTAATLILAYEQDPELRERARVAMAVAVDWRIRGVGPENVPPSFLEFEGEAIAALVTSWEAEDEVNGVPLNTRGPRLRSV
jgi:hypothetical protein